MYKWLILYSSVTGNTRKIAAEIASASGGELVSIDNLPKDLSSYDIVAVGYWLWRGGPDPKTREILPQLQDKTIVLFQTQGTEPGSEHSVTALARAAYLLGKNCDILGTFSAQGKINPALIAKRKKAPADGFHTGAEAQKRWQRAAGHPDAEDLKNARLFVAQMERKLSAKRKFAARQ